MTLSKLARFFWDIFIYKYKKSLYGNLPGNIGFVFLISIWHSLQMPCLPETQAFLPLIKFADLASLCVWFAFFF